MEGAIGHSLISCLSNQRNPRLRGLQKEVPLKSAFGSPNERQGINIHQHPGAKVPLEGRWPALLWMVAKSSSAPPFRNPAMIRFPCKYHQNNGVNHGLKWCEMEFCPSTVCSSKLEQNKHGVRPQPSAARQEALLACQSHVTQTFGPKHTVDPRVFAPNLVFYIHAMFYRRCCLHMEQMTSPTGDVFSEICETSSWVTGVPIKAWQQAKRES